MCHFMAICLIKQITHFSEMFVWFFFFKEFFVCYIFSYEMSFSFWLHTSDTTCGKPWFSRISTTERTLIFRCMSTSIRNLKPETCVQSKPKQTRLTFHSTDTLDPVTDLHVVSLKRHEDSIGVVGFSLGVNL